MILRPSRLNAARPATRRAFTLMEVLVVVAIIFILASASTIIVFQYLADSKEKLAKAGVKTLETAIKAHYTLYGEWPQSLEVLTQPINNKPAALDIKALVDPWERPYMYNPQEQHPTTSVPKIWSTGENPGNAAGFISNW